MEIKVNALVTRAIEYKENDKILTLYSYEKGKITAGIKGVKKSGAKLKFASEPFCFAEFILASKGERNTVINATFIDSFYNLRTNLLKYYCSSVIAETVNLLVEQETGDENLFNLIINTVKNLCYGENEKAVLCKYLYLFSKYNGYELQDTTCYDCGEDIVNRVFFNPNNATFSCNNCKDLSFMEITAETYNTLKILSKMSFEEISSMKEIINCDKLLKFLFFYLNVKTDVKLVSSDLVLTDI